MEDLKGRDIIVGRLIRKLFKRVLVRDGKSYSGYVDCKEMNLRLFNKIEYGDWI